MIDLSKVLPQIERAAQRKGIALKQLCKLAGIDYWTLRRWQLRKHKPQMAKIEKLQRALEDGE